MKEPAAFISYARRDDAAYGGRITRLRQRLQGLVASAIGRDFEIFQDRHDIAWGQHWPTRLDEALEEALFLIPILTPSYFNSEACRAELETFLELERRSGRKDRILSLYFLDAPVYEQKAHGLAAMLSERQHRDWRHLRNDPLGSAKVRRALDRLAGELADAIHTRQGEVSPLASMLDPKAVVPTIEPSVPTARQPSATEQARTAPLERSRLAREYLETLPKRVQQLSVEAKRRRLTEIERSREIRELIDSVSHTLANLVRNFGSEGATIVFSDAPFPLNIFSSEPFQLRLYVDQTDYWSFHFVDRELDKIGLMLVRVVKIENGQQTLTNDSIVFRWVGADKYVFSLNSRISAEVRENVFGDLDTQVHPISQAKQDLDNLMINLVKYELARKHAKIQPLTTPEGASRLRSPQILPGTVFRDIEATWCPELVMIPAGSFVMGSPEPEEGRHRDEGPQHEVTFAQPFALGRYPVTFQEYDHFCAETKRKKPPGQGWGRGRRPAINVSWEGAKAYVKWLSKQTGHPYRLPSEAEWEYACRAGATTPFWTGATIATEQANYDGNYTYDPGRKGEYRERTTPVDTFEANPWGLHDMHGTVWEWVEDCWNDSYDAPRRSDEGSAWTSGDCGLRVLRGDSWSNKPESLRSANRSRHYADTRTNDFGFRVARTLTP